MWLSLLLMPLVQSEVAILAAANKAPLCSASKDLVLVAIMILLW
jgi:hypothetical protein